MIIIIIVIIVLDVRLTKGHSDTRSKLLSVDTNNALLLLFCCNRFQICRLKQLLICIEANNSFERHRAVPHPSISPFSAWNWTIILLSEKLRGTIKNRSGRGGLRSPRREPRVITVSLNFRLRGGVSGRGEFIREISADREAGDNQHSCRPGACTKALAPGERVPDNSALGECVLTLHAYTCLPGERSTRRPPG